MIAIRYFIHILLVVTVGKKSLVMFCIKRIFKLLRIGLVCLRKLLSFGVNPDVEDGVGRSPLQWAASAGIHTYYICLRWNRRVSFTLDCVR